MLLLILPMTELKKCVISPSEATDFKTQHDNVLSVSDKKINY